MPRVLDCYLERLSGDADCDLAAAAALATSLQDFDGKGARFCELEFPAGPILRARPVAQRVLVRQGLIA